MTSSIIDRPSANQGSRRPVSNGDQTSSPISLIVLHYTGMTTCDEALTRMCDPHSEVSAHYLIDEDGTTYQLVPESQRAWHAGRSYWRGTTDVNSASIGIELVNPGHEHGYRPFPAPQIARLTVLCRDIMDRHNMPAQGVVGHSDIAPGRKLDPGELFPWADLASRGVGVWPESPSPPEPTADGTVWDDLATIGYADPRSERYGGAILDATSGQKDVLTAFQRRFMPSNMTGVADAATLSCARAVAALFS